MSECLHEEFRIARKDHKCSGCLAVIPKGTKYKSATCVYDSRIYNWKTCDICREVEKYFDYDDYEEFSEGEYINHPKYDEIKVDFQKLIS